MKTDASHRVFSTRRLVRFTEMEYAVPRADGPEALSRVLDMIERRGYAVPFPIEYRIVSGDDAYLSTAHERETVYIAVHMYRGMVVGAVLPCGRGDHGRLRGPPALGQAPLPVRRHAGAALPEWDRFQAVRARLDPTAGSRTSTPSACSARSAPRSRPRLRPPARVAATYPALGRVAEIVRYLSLLPSAGGGMMAP